MSSATFWVAAWRALSACARAATALAERGGSIGGEVVAGVNPFGFPGSDVSADDAGAWRAAQRDFAIQWVEFGVEGFVDLGCDLVSLAERRCGPWHLSVGGVGLVPVGAAASFGDVVSNPAAQAVPAREGGCVRKQGGPGAGREQEDHDRLQESWQMLQTSPSEQERQPDCQWPWQLGQAWRSPVQEGQGFGSVW